MFHRLLAAVSLLLADPVRLRVLLFAILLLLALTAILAPGPHVVAGCGPGGPCPTP